jgi:hypothetical protein
MSNVDYPFRRWTWRLEWNSTFYSKITLRISFNHLYVAAHVLLYLMTRNMNVVTMQPTSLTAAAATTTSTTAAA